MEDYIAIVQQFGRTYRSFMSAFEAQVGHAMPRWRILLALTDPDGEWSQKRLVERLRIDPGALTRQLKSLEALGWIERSVDTRDNRITNVRLTSEGRQAVDASLPQRNAFLLETMGALPDDALSALSNALTKLEARIGEVAGSPLPGSASSNPSGEGGGGRATA
ncbi:MarR family winged helix-turn-helix transcriptional regulator [Trinickia diaoshuihuensis]|jgi:DNA-binding MarR family transcriptional regulator|uniref:MarR family winged helix-turn-helix transcriptional regulator n=1 Tax=Trinickia diaoshuihuensis TaxID=2292265 RepID=UPI000E270BB8|nr:MarR family winged helix-turn-helix transcriptional regulator [Trinickia diaoshuihuensis]